MGLQVGPKFLDSNPVSPAPRVAGGEVEFTSGGGGPAWGNFSIVYALAWGSTVGLFGKVSDSNMGAQEL